MKVDPRIQLLRNAVCYDRDSGHITWMVRPNSHFKADRFCSAWNAVWPGKPAFSTMNGRGYLHGKFMGKDMLAHVAAWAITYGEFPYAQIDHINFDKSDNRIKNLRQATSLENSKHKPNKPRGASGIVGVFPQSGGFIVRVGSSYVGYFKDINEAKSARLAAAKSQGYNQ